MRRQSLPIMIAALLGACATASGSGDLSGSNWSVRQINGQLATGSIRFGASSFDGDFGCNRFAGTYRIDGDRLQARSLTASQMACHSLDTPDPDAPMRAEQAGFAILGSGPVMERPGDDRLRLRSGAGSIDLTRLPGPLRR